MQSSTQLVLAQKNFCCSCRTFQTTSLQSFNASRNGLRFCTSGTPEKETNGTQAHRNSLLSRATMGQRKASIGWTRGYEKQRSISLRYPRNFGCISMKTRPTESITTALVVEQGCTPFFRTSVPVEKSDRLEWSVVRENVATLKGVAFGISRTITKWLDLTSGSCLGFSSSSAQPSRP